jgi:hypothetical protein
VLRDLLAAVPDDMPPLIHASVTHSLGLHSSTLAYDKTGKLLRKFGDVDPSTEGYMLRVERAKLRDWLSHNLTIEYGKRLQRFEEHETGVTAVFTDGTSAAGSILVGADGTNSTGKPLNPHFNPADVSHPVPQSASSSSPRNRASTISQSPA